MDQTEIYLDIPDSELAHAEDEARLADQWVRRFELGVEDRASAPTDPRPGVRGSHGVGSSIERMRSDWITHSRAGGRGRPEPEETPASTVDALPMKASGLLATFTDRIGGTISLSHADGRLQHRGTVALRGPGSAVEDVCKDIGMPDQVTRAFEFVAAWFGSPFDAVNLRAADDHVLTWGFSGFAGQDLARCLHEWKMRAPDAFAAYCVAFGLDVAGGERDSQDVADGRPMLSVAANGRSLQGRAAEWTIATEPRLLAVLARAGRDAAAQRAQIEVAVATWVTPIMFEPWDHKPGDDGDREADGERMTVDVLRSARAIASLLYLVRRHGLRAVTRLMRVVTERWRPQDDEEAWIEGLVRSLRHLKRAHEASEVLRIASSPELTRNAN